MDAPPRNPYRSTRGRGPGRFRRGDRRGRSRRSRADDNNAVVFAGERESHARGLVISEFRCVISHAHVGLVWPSLNAHPPSMESTWPVMKPAASDSRNALPRPKSRGTAARPTGKRLFGRNKVPDCFVAHCPTRHRRIGKAGCDHIGPDAFGSVARRDRSRESLDRRLGCGVGVGREMTGGGMRREYGADVDDRAAALPAKLPHCASIRKEYGG